MNKSLLAFIPNPTDATSFYRASGPLKALQKKMNFRMERGSEVNWDTLKSHDVVFLQRPFTDIHVKIVDMAKANGKKVWVDYDDDLFNVPRSNRTYKLYGNPKNQNNIAQIIGKADNVTVSTVALLNQFSAILDLVKRGAPEHLDQLVLDGRKIVLTPNAYDVDFVAHYRKDRAKPEPNKLVTWRGSDTHDKDLMSVTQELKAVLSGNLDWTMNFIGSPFWHTIESLEEIQGIKENNVLETESLDPAEYWKFLWVTAPSLMIAPLWDCPFNRAKSNIAWIEGLHAGAVTLAPNFEEWRRPGVINYDSPMDFADKMLGYLKGEFDREALYLSGWEFIMDNLTLSRVNILREIMLSELFG